MNDHIKESPNGSSPNKSPPGEIDAAATAASVGFCVGALFPVALGLCSNDLDAGVGAWLGVVLGVVVMVVAVVAPAPVAGASALGGEAGADDAADKDPEEGSEAEGVTVSCEMS